MPGTPTGIAGAVPQERKLPDRLGQSKLPYLLCDCAVGGWNGRQGQKKFAFVTLPAANSCPSSEILGQLAA